MVVNDFCRVERKVRVMAALLGSVVVSAPALCGRGGTRLEFRRGLDMEVAIFLTDTFKAEEPGLTLIMREACHQGWKAVRMEGLKGRGRKPSLLLKGRAETVQGFQRTGVKCMTSLDFVQWLNRTCLNKSLSAHVSKTDQ